MYAVWAKDRRSNVIELRSFLSVGNDQFTDDIDFRPTRPFLRLALRPICQALAVGAKVGWTDLHKFRSGAGSVDHRPVFFGLGGISQTQAIEAEHGRSQVLKRRSFHSINDHPPLFLALGGKGQSLAVRAENRATDFCEFRPFLAIDEHERSFSASACIGVSLKDVDF